MPRSGDVPPCPACEKADAVRFVLYGMPSGDVEEQAEDLHEAFESFISALRRQVQPGEALGWIKYLQRRYVVRN